MSMVENKNTAPTTPTPVLIGWATIRLSYTRFQLKTNLLIFLLSHSVIRCSRNFGQHFCVGNNSYVKRECSISDICSCKTDLINYSLRHAWTSRIAICPEMRQTVMRTYAPNSVYPLRIRARFTCSSLFYVQT